MRFFYLFMDPMLIPYNSLLQSKLTVNFPKTPRSTRLITLAKRMESAHSSLVMRLKSILMTSRFHSFLRVCCFSSLFGCHLDPLLRPYSTFISLPLCYIRYMHLVQCTCSIMILRLFSNSDVGFRIFPTVY